MGGSWAVRGWLTTPPACVQVTKSCSHFFASELPLETLRLAWSTAAVDPSSFLSPFPPFLLHSLGSLVPSLLSPLGMGLSERAAETHSCFVLSVPAASPGGLRSALPGDIILGCDLLLGSLYGTRANATNPRAWPSSLASVRWSFRIERGQLGMGHFEQTAPPDGLVQFPPGSRRCPQLRES